jgi:hypothetical protein
LELLLDLSGLKRGDAFDAFDSLPSLTDLGVAIVWSISGPGVMRLGELEPGCYLGLRFAILVWNFISTVENPPGTRNMEHAGGVKSKKLASLESIPGNSSRFSALN